MTTTLARSPGVRTDLDAALSGAGGPAAVRHFLDVVGPAEVQQLLQACLPADCPPLPALRLARAKLKPGRTLDAWYVVAAADGGGPRWTSVRWVAAGGTPPGPAPAVADEACRRGVLGNWQAAWAASGDARSSVRVAPVDADFPQLPRLHDVRHLVPMLRAAGVPVDALASEVVVSTVRYRPGQRHVLRVDAGAAASVLFLKVYRDGAGGRAVVAARRLTAALRDAGVPATAGRGSYAPDDLTAVWEEVPGRVLSDLVAAPDAAVAEAVAGFGATLRAVHGAPAWDGLGERPGADGAGAQTVRAGRHVTALAPQLGARMESLAGRCLDVLAALPGEPPTVAHGDAKGDNVIVEGAVTHVLDLDRCGLGDPAEDVGKAMADLRWCSGGDRLVAAALCATLLDGYLAAGPVAAARVARAQAYDAMFQLRLAARRAPLQDESWQDQVEAAVAGAADTLESEALA